MVQYGQHHDGVEVTGATNQEGCVFTILPTGGGCGMSEVDAEGENILSAALEAGGEAVDRLKVGVDRDDFGSGVGSQPRVDACVTANIEKTCGF